MSFASIISDEDSHSWLSTSTPNGEMTSTTASPARESCLMPVTAPVPFRSETLHRRWERTDLLEQPRKSRHDWACRCNKKRPEFPPGVDAKRFEPSRSRNSTIDYLAGFFSFALSANSDLYCSSVFFRASSLPGKPISTAFSWISTAFSTFPCT